MPPAVDATWVGVIAGVIGLAAALLARRWANRNERETAIRHAAKMWREARNRGDAEGVVIWKREYDYLKAGGQLAVILAASLCLSGCRTVPPVIIPVGDHIMFPESGFTVPALPEGQKRWMLLTVPTGVEMALPTDFPLEEIEP